MYNQPSYPHRLGGWGGKIEIVIRGTSTLGDGCTWKIKRKKGVGDYRNPSKEAQKEDIFLQTYIQISRIVQSVAFPYLYLEGKFPNNVLEVQIHADISPGEELLYIHAFCPLCVV